MMMDQLMNQSTIYRRHETRLAKTNALKDDPRPALLRVLSGLPGFRIIVPPFVPQSADGALARPQEQVSFSEETLFTSEHSKKEKTDSHNNIVLRSFLAAGIAGGASEFFFGVPPSKRQSPFAGTSSGQVAPLLQEEKAAFAATRLRGAPKPDLFQIVPLSQAMVGALSASVLFGSKILVADMLGDSKNNDFSSVASLTSSAGAGAVVATIRAPMHVIQVLNSHGFPLKHVSSLIRNHGLGVLYQGAASTYAREMFGATVYFAAYSTVKSSFMEEDSSNAKASNTSVAVAGAIAGVLYQGIRMVGVSSVSHQSQSVFVASAPAAVFPAMIRAAPAHAFLFLCYENAMRQLDPCGRQ